MKGSKCHECGDGKSNLFPLVTSSIIYPVLICKPCKESKYPWLGLQQTIRQRDWFSDTMRPTKETEFEEREGRPARSPKGNGLRKCQYGEEGHGFVLARPNHLGAYGNAMRAVPVKEVYEREIEASHRKGWMTDRVFVFWECSRCGKRKYEVLPFGEVEQLIANL